MNVYLSFDDGIQPGTKEVLNVLRITGVRATFFLTGINSDHFFNTNKDDFLIILEDIYQNHAIGNHSYTHGFDDYELYYSQGVFLDDTNVRKSILEDFRKNSQTINSYLESLDGYNKSPRHILHANQQSVALARFPATNIWKVNIGPRNSWLNKFIYKTSFDNQSITEKIYNDGYQIFGWDIEWRMNFDFYLESLKLKEGWTVPVTFNILKEHYNNIDMYSKENQNKDRVCDPWELIAKQVLNYHEDKVVLLMHERAFRKPYDSVPLHIDANKQDKILNNESEKLYNLIIELKKQNCNFATLDTYTTKGF